MNLYEPLLRERSSDRITMAGDQVHHFRNVLRGKAEDEVSLFDGAGLVFKARVVAVTKKELELEILNELTGLEVETKCALTLGVPKKEYLESMIRSAIQVGVRKINLVQTKFSPWVYRSYSRLDKIMISSMLQSENPILPTIVHFDSLEDFLSQQEETLVFSTELADAVSSDQKLSHFTNIFIGPEGGFHQEELTRFHDSKQIQCVRINAPIMKAEVAVPFCLGWSAAK